MIVVSLSAILRPHCRLPVNQTLACSWVATRRWGRFQPHLCLESGLALCPLSPAESATVRLPGPGLGEACSFCLSPSWNLDSPLQRSWGLLEDEIAHRVGPPGELSLTAKPVRAAISEHADAGELPDSCSQRSRPGATRSPSPPSPAPQNCEHSKPLSLWDSLLRII